MLPNRGLAIRVCAGLGAQGKNLCYLSRSCCNSSSICLIQDVYTVSPAPRPTPLSLSDNQFLVRYQQLGVCEGPFTVSVCQRWQLAGHYLGYYQIGHGQVILDLALT